MCEAKFIHKENGEMDIDHTYVNPVLRGQGVAGKMSKALQIASRFVGFMALPYNPQFTNSDTG